jgi:hypothetical protein
MRFGAIRPKWRAPNEIGTKSFQLYYGHPQFTGKRLLRAMQRTQFCAKNAQNDLKPTDFLKRNVCFEMEGVHAIVICVACLSYMSVGYMFYVT